MDPGLAVVYGSMIGGVPATVGAVMGVLNKRHLGHRNGHTIEQKLSDMPTIMANHMAEDERFQTTLMPRVEFLEEEARILKERRHAKDNDPEANPEGWAPALINVVSRLSESVETLNGRLGES